MDNIVASSPCSVVLSRDYLSVIYKLCITEIMDRQCIQNMGYVPAMLDMCSWETTLEVSDKSFIFKPSFMFSQILGPDQYVLPFWA